MRKRKKQSFAWQFLRGERQRLPEAESEPTGWQAHWDYDVLLAVWNVKEIHVDDQGITYALRTDGTAAVVDCESNVTEIVLAVDGYAITDICASALENHGSMTSITIPKSVVVIEQYSFHYCYALEAIHFDGTMAEWNAIEMGDETGISENCTVYCTDGNVEI